MEKLKKIFTNPIAIAIVIMHWFVFFLAIFLERDLIFSETITFHGPEPVIYNFMLFLNSPAVWIMEFLITPVLSFFEIEKNLFSGSFVYLIFVAVGSLQWLCLGHLISAVVEIYKPKEVKLSLK